MGCDGWTGDNSSAFLRQKEYEEQRSAGFRKPTVKFPSPEKPPTVQQLLEQKNRRSNVDVPTALHYAAEKGHLQMFRVLYEHPATDTQAISHHGKTVLSTAAVNGQEEILQYLLDKEETDVNRKDKNGFTALHYAAQSGHLPIFKALFQHPATDIQAATFDDRNALDIAAIYQDKRQ